MKFVYMFVLLFASVAPASTLLECKKDGALVASVVQWEQYLRKGSAIWTELLWPDGTHSFVDSVVPSEQTSSGGCMEHTHSILKGWNSADVSLTYETWVMDGKGMTRCAGMHNSGDAWILQKTGGEKVYLECSAPAAAPAVAMSMAHPSDVSVHGMVVFGHDTIYLSHMPMFHPPHDEQAIFEAKLDAAGLAAYKSVKELVTIVPEEMSLMDLIAHPHSFKADLYEGHFERGGHMIASQIEVQVLSVVHAHKVGALVAGVVGAPIKFGSSDAQYEAHFITNAPDFDEIKEAGVVIYHEDQDLAD